ncbi:AraC family transcriptional regulator [Curtobacterium sp. VKM Ac-1376]|nr:AraC family transcriptional regulator [Curtobacterium sp. VKM Ac-1376]
MQWRASVTKAVAAFRADGPTSAAWQEAKRDVARALLALYPLREEPSPAAPGSQIDAPLQAALDYLRNHAREQVTVADVAAAAGISIRTLQERFKRTLGRSPLTYLRDIRLDEVHAELQAPEPGMTTVAQVARYWGFGHLGRFSAEYTKRFGQYPRHTLRTR